jgi:hypothetical protein
MQLVVTRFWFLQTAVTRVSGINHPRLAGVMVVLQGEHCISMVLTLKLRG